MDQKAYLAVTAMLNSFPQVSGNPDLTMTTYEAVLRDVSSQAVIEAAQRFTVGDVPGQSRTFAPSIAEFTQEARKVAEIIPLRNRPKLPGPIRERFYEPQPHDKVRMGFKMSMLSMGLSRRDVDAVALANERGLDDLLALAQTWGVPIPEELFNSQAA